MARRIRLLFVVVLLTSAFVVPFAPPASAGTFETVGEILSPRLVLCRTKAKATTSSVNATTRRVDWVTSSTCNQAVPYLRTEMLLSSGFPLNVVIGPSSSSCVNCTHVQLSGWYNAPLNHLHYLTATIHGYDPLYVQGQPHGVWTPVPLLVPCTPTVWNYLLYPGTGNCVTNTVFNTSS